MIRILIIFLLIVGCGIFEPEGICVLINTETNTYNCYPQRPEAQCKSDAGNSETIMLRYWGKSYDCNEFCNSQITDELCEIH